jgi:VCBS repeat-containing protein
VDDSAVAANDAATVNEDASAPTINVLANDTNAGGVTIVSVTQPANGTVAITNAGANLTYTPNANYCNDPPGTTPDTFTYTLSAGGSTATVSVKVTCLDDPPVAVADAATVLENSGATAIDVLANDTDVDGGAKSVTSVTQPANGTVVITGGGTGLTYQPNANYCNSTPGSPLDTFTYTLTGGSSTTVTVTVTCVDASPVAVNDAATVNEDATATTINVLANDTDTDGGPKSITSVTQPTNGTVAITNAGADLTYTPNANYCNSPPGTTLDTFTYTLTPGGSTATVSVTVTCLDDPPAAVADAATVAQNAGATAVNVLANDTDVDGGPKSITSVTQPLHGTVVITGGGTGVTYQPNSNYCNSPPGTTLDTFTYTLTPGGSSTTVTVTVTCVVDPNP